MLENFLENRTKYQVLVAALLGVIVCSFVVNHLLSSISLFKATVIISVGSILLLFLVYLFRLLKTEYTLKELSIYAFVIASFFGSAILSIKVGPISIFPYRILLPIILFLFLIKLIFTNDTFRFNEVKVKPILLFYIIWALYGTFSLVWAQSFTQGVRGVVFLWSGIFFILLFLFLMKRGENFRDLFYIWIIVLVCMIGIGLWNHFTLNHLPVSRMYNAPAYIRHRPTGVFTNENDYASYLALSIFIVLSFVRYVRVIALKLIGLALLLASIYLLLVTSSRANLLALIIGGVFWFLFTTSRLEKKKILFFGVFGLMTFSILYFPKVESLYREIEHQILSIFIVPDTPDTSMDIRANLIKNAIYFFGNSFGFGVGAGNAETYMRTGAIYPTFGTLNVHNWWIEIMLNYGAFIFVGYVLVYIGLIVQLYKVFKKSVNRIDKMISEGLCISLISFSFASISPSSIMTLNYVWILFALAIGYLNYFYRKMDYKEELIKNE